MKIIHQLMSEPGLMARTSSVEHGIVCGQNPIDHVRGDRTMTPINFQISISLDDEAADRLVTFVRRIITTASENEQKREARLRSSRTAIFAGHKLPTDKGLLVDIKETAKLLSVSKGTLLKLCRNGEMPAPIRIGRGVRWSYDALQAWVDAKCPRVENS